jgi:alpha-amylase/alpha-mannosidase (GH57 family)
LEEVQIQISADPYHDWNARITAECYGPNATARILDDRGRIANVVNNYASISFNFGPTLLSWLERHDLRTYRAVLDADALSRERFSGHGSAMAQVYGHAILPLCNERDRQTQVRWGITDFERRFGRAPAGMWLPETGVDVPSLESLAEHGIRFTVLAPSQAAAVRRLGERDWIDVGTGTVDPRMPYRVFLPSGASIDLFFYDGPVSQAVAFERLLARGERFAGRLMQAFDSNSDAPQLVHIATDGETYGHHHRFGDMALAYALRTIERERQARLTNYAEYLALHPPTYEARIQEKTAWSCAHGLGRWTEDCGCAIGAAPHWHQRWRAPLRAALDGLRDELSPQFERRAASLFGDPWGARDRYIDVVMDRSRDNVERFLAAEARRELGDHERSEALGLLEMQRHALLMYTSCGWFFDEPSGIETRQILQYASRAAQLAEELFGGPFETRLLERLERVPSNLAEFGNARTIYERRVRPTRFGPERVAADRAASWLFQNGEATEAGPAYRVREIDRQAFEAGPARLIVGHVAVESTITLESSDLICGFLHLGGHNIEGGVSTDRGKAGYARLVQDVAEVFPRADVAETRQALQRHLGPLNYSLRTLSRDQRRRIVDRILTSTVEETEGVFERLNQEHAPLMRFLSSQDTTAPRVLRATADLALNTRLRRDLERQDADPRALRQLLAEARDEAVELDGERLAYALRSNIEVKLARLSLGGDDVLLLERLAETAALLDELPYEINLARAQIDFFELARTTYPELKNAARRGDPGARRRIEAYRSLGDALHVVVEPGDVE